jgi:AraC family transcriptional regulator
MSSLQNTSQYSMRADLAKAPELIRRPTRLEPALLSKGRGWRGLELYRWHGLVEACDLTFEDLVILFHIGGSRDVHAWVGGKWRDERSSPGEIIVLPPRTRIFWQTASQIGEVDGSSLHLAPSRFASLLDGTLGQRVVERIPFRMSHRDPFLSHMMLALEDEVREPKEHGSLFVDTVADSVALYLFRNYAQACPTPIARGGLSPRLLRIAYEKIEAGIEAGTSLDELAASVDLSRWHFARAFREATGLSPHRYLMQRRVERAKTLLSRSDQPITDIALACGFSSQAHFSAVFHLATGASPRAFRRSVQ